MPEDDFEHTMIGSLSLVVLARYTSLMSFRPSRLLCFNFGCIHPLAYSSHGKGNEDR